MNELLLQYGESPLLLFLVVFAASVGLPVPALVTLIIVGGQMASSSSPDLAIAFGSALAGALLGDIVWYWLGARYGERLLAGFARWGIPVPAVWKEEEAVRRGGMMLLIARFVPGLSTVAAPLAGVSHLRASYFLGYDALGSSLWIALGLILGISFSHELDQMVVLIHQMGQVLLAGGAAVVLLLGARWYAKLHTARRKLNAHPAANNAHQANNDEVSLDQPAMLVPLNKLAEISSAEQPTFSVGQAILTTMPVYQSVASQRADITEKNMAEKGFAKVEGFIPVLTCQSKISACNDERWERAQAHHCCCL